MFTSLIFIEMTDKNQDSRNVVYIDTGLKTNFHLNIFVMVKKIHKIQPLQTQSKFSIRVCVSLTHSPFPFTILL